MQHSHVNLCTRQVNDINAADASFEHQTIVTGDDFSLVKLFRFPCVKKGECRLLCAQTTWLFCLKCSTQLLQ